MPVPDETRTLFQRAVCSTVQCLKRKNVLALEELANYHWNDTSAESCHSKDWNFESPSLDSVLDIWARWNRKEDSSKAYNGWHPIHLATLLGKMDVTVRIIAKEPDSVNAKFLGSVTPLMCAAVAGSVAVMNLLFEHGATFSDKKDLECAIKGKNAACLKFVTLHADLRLVSSQPIDIMQFFSQGILEDDAEILQVIMNLMGSLKKQVPSLTSPTLTQKFQASKRINVDWRKLFFYALEKGYSKIVKVLLKSRFVQCRFTSDGLPPLHFTILKHVKDETAAIMIHILLDNGLAAFINETDIDRKTALYYAAKAGFRQCSFQLIGSQALISTTDMRNLNERVPRFLKTHLDNQISSKGTTSSPSGELVSIDLKFMGAINNEGEEFREINFLQYIVSDGQEDLLSHPVIQTYLHVKWIFFRKFFISSLLFYIVQLVFYTIYISMMYISEPGLDGHNGSGSNNSEEFPHKNRHDDTLVTFGIMGTCSIICTRICYISISTAIYIRTNSYSKGHIFRHFTEYLTIVLITVTLLPIVREYEEDLPEWLRATAAISILVVWCNTLWYFTRHPELGIYIEMLRKVFKNFATFSATYGCLLIGYALSFYVMLNGKRPFQTILTSLREVFRMMIGEVEIEETKDINVVHYALYMGFMLTVTVALINLLIGLAVHDIQGLLDRSKINKSIRQIQYMSIIESVIYSRTLDDTSLLPDRVKKFLRRSIKIKLPANDDIVFVFPNKSDDRRLPVELKQSALGIARKNLYRENQRKSSEAHGAHLHTPGMMPANASPQLMRKQHKSEK